MIGTEETGFDSAQPDAGALIGDLVIHFRVYPQRTEIQVQNRAHTLNHSIGDRNVALSGVEGRFFALVPHRLRWDEIIASPCHCERAFERRNLSGLLH